MPLFRTSIPVFCYHDVGDAAGPSVETFARHLDAIAEAGFTTISARELLAVVRGERKARPRSALLTFDDGHVSSWLTVAPELERRGMTAAFFLLTDFTKPGAPRRAADLPEVRPLSDSFKAALDGDCSQFLNEGEARAMLDRGMEIFSHGCRHQGVFRTLRPGPVMGAAGSHWACRGIYPRFKADWPGFDVASAYVYDGFRPEIGADDRPRFVRRSAGERLALCRRDFAESLERIRALNGFDEQLFCWPWGQFCPDAEAELRRAGYAGAFTLERWVNARGTDPFRLNRIGVGRRKDAKWVRARLRMYGSDPAARVFFKLFRKRPEINRVLYVTDSDKLSGGSRQMVNNIKAMSDMGIRTCAVLAPGSPIAGALDGLDVEVIFFDGFRHYLRAGRFLRNLVNRRGVDVVHTFHNRAYKMGVLARLMGARCRLFINRGVISRPNDVFFLWTALSDGVVANSMQCARMLRDHHVLRRRLNVVYNAYVGPGTGVSESADSGPRRVMYVGNAAPVKGFDVFVRAAGVLCDGGACDDVEFVAVGVGPEAAQRLEGDVPRNVARRLRLLGDLPHDRVLAELAGATLLVVSSRKESLPNVLLEGFDCGLPVVCTRVGGIPEVVEDGLNGFLCPSEAADCLARNIRRLLDDPALRAAQGGLNRRIVRTLLTPEAKGRSLMRVYMGETLCEPLRLSDAGVRPEDGGRSRAAGR